MRVKHSERQLSAHDQGKQRVVTELIIVIRPYRDTRGHEKTPQRGTQSEGYQAVVIASSWLGGRGVGLAGDRALDA